MSRHTIVFSRLSFVRSLFVVRSNHIQFEFYFQLSYSNFHYFCFVSLFRFIKIQFIIFFISSLKRDFSRIFLPLSRFKCSVVSVSNFRSLYFRSPRSQRSRFASGISIYCDRILFRFYCFDFPSIFIPWVGLPRCDLFNYYFPTCAKLKVTLIFAPQQNISHFTIWHVKSRSN